MNTNSYAINGLARRLELDRLERTCQCNTTEWCPCWQRTDGPCLNCKSRACRVHAEEN